MLKMTIDNEEVLSDNDISIKEEILSPSSTILNNVYPKSWELDKDYTSRFYYPKDYSKLNIQNFSIEPEEAGTTIQINGSATLTDVDTSKESRVLRLLGQTSQNGTPTPTSPIPINVVSGDNTINICGKNLLNVQWESGSIGGNGSNIDDTKSIRTTRQKIKSGTQYTFSSTTSTSISQFWVYYYNNDTFVSRAGMSSGNTKTFTTPSGVNYIRFRLTATSDITPSIISDAQLELGDTQTTFEPYIENTYPLYLGMKNLWNRTDVKDGFLPQSGSYPVTNSSYPNSKYIIVPLLTGQKLTLSGSTSSTGRVRCIDKDTNQVVNAFTATETEYYTTTHAFGDAFYNATITAKKDFLVGIMDYVSFNQYLIVNYGATPQYISDTPIELCKIGTYQDYIYKDNGSWYLHKEIGKVVFDGSESWQNAGTNPQKWSLSKSDYKYVEENICLSNYFKSTTNGAVGIMTDNQIKFRYHTDQAKWLYICDNTFSAVADFKNWLSTHNLILYYVLATSTNTEITDALLLSQLNDLES